MKSSKIQTQRYHAYHQEDLSFLDIKSESVECVLIGSIDEPEKPWLMSLYHFLHRLHIIKNSDTQFQAMDTQSENDTQCNGDQLNSV